MTQTFSFDATDLNIVEQLRRNGRANNQQVAETLGLTATTVSTRIKRMEDADQLRVVAVSDFSAHGFNVLQRVWVEVDGRPASEVARRAGGPIPSPRGRRRSPPRGAAGWPAAARPRTRTRARR